MTHVSLRAGRRISIGLLVLASAGAIILWQTLRHDGASLSAKVATGSHRDSLATEPGIGNPRVAPSIQRVQHQQSSNFSLFRHPPEGLPAATRKILGRPAYGMNWSLAQRLPVRGDYWAVPGNGYLCVVEQANSGASSRACAPTKYVVAHGVGIVSIGAGHSRSSGHRLIVGVAPNGTRQVLVHTDGSVATVPVVGNVFTLRDSSSNPPERLTLR